MFPKAMHNSMGIHYGQKYFPFCIDFEWVDSRKSSYLYLFMALGQAVVSN